MPRLRLVFMGTPEFAVPALLSLLDAGCDVISVYTAPPRPAGRGYAARRSAVHELALARGLPLRTPANLQDKAEQQAFAELAADAAVVAAYGLILPPAMLGAPRLGCLNVHASLLPRWRGAAPIQRAILAGDAETGVTIMRMDEGLDTGAILLRERVPIGASTTAGELDRRLAALGAGLIVEALGALDAGTIEPKPQPAEGVTYADKLGPADGVLDWREPAAALERRVRAHAPRPGAWFTHRGTRIKVLAAAPAEGAPKAPPGRVLDGRLTVNCGDGALRLTRLQREGRAAMDAAAFLRGFALPQGSTLSGDDGGGP